jgi:hypothetical protein
MKRDVSFQKLLSQQRTTLDVQYKTILQTKHLLTSTLCDFGIIVSDATVIDFWTLGILGLAPP